MNNRKNIILECIISKNGKKSRYYTKKNIKNNNKIILKKYNYIIRKRTIHKEI